MRAYDNKIIFAGPVGAGKTTAIGAISDIAPVTTDARASDMTLNRKDTTTVALDYGVLMLDEADMYLPAIGQPSTKAPMENLLKRARSAGLGIMLATQSPGDLDYKSRDQITSWFIGRVREDTALRKLKAAFQSESGLDPAAVLPGQTVGEFHLVQEGLVRAMKAQRSLIEADQVPFDRIEQIGRAHVLNSSH